MSGFKVYTQRLIHYQHFSIRSEHYHTPLKIRINMNFEFTRPLRTEKVNRHQSSLITKEP